MLQPLFFQLFCGGFVLELTDRAIRKARLFPGIISTYKSHRKDADDGMDEEDGTDAGDIPGQPKKVSCSFFLLLSF